MAKSKREIYQYQCLDCKSKNYSTEVNKQNLKEKKLEVKKFCPKCGKHTMHKAAKI